MNKIQNIFFNSTYNPNTNIYSEYFLKKFLLFFFKYFTLKDALFIVSIQSLH